jgi:hypothetical protein
MAMLSHEVNRKIELGIAILRSVRLEGLDSEGEVLLDLRPDDQTHELVEHERSLAAMIEHRREHGPFHLRPQKREFLRDISRDRLVALSGDARGTRVHDAREVTYDRRTSIRLKELHRITDQITSALSRQSAPSRVNHLNLHK